MPLSRRPLHSTTSKIGLICLLLLPLRDFFELLLLLRRLRDFFVCSCAISSLINDPLSTTISQNLEGDAGERLEFGVEGGEQSRSSNTSGKSSSSEMMKELDCEYSSA